MSKQLMKYNKTVIKKNIVGIFIIIITVIMIAINESMVGLSYIK